MTWLARRVAGRAPTALLLVGMALVGVGRALVALWQRPWLLWTLAGVGFMVSAILRDGWQAVVTVAVLAALAVVVALAAWSWLAPRSWRQRVTVPLLSARRARYYRGRWEEAVTGCGLVRADVVPTLMSVRSGNGVDRLLVHLAPGQLPADWRDVAPRLAAALEVRSVRVRREGPRDVLLLARYREVRARDDVTAPELEAEVEETVRQHDHPDRDSAPVVWREERSQPATRGAFPRRPR